MFCLSTRLVRYITILIILISCITDRSVSCNKSIGNSGTLKSKQEFITELKNSKHINIAELLKKKVRNSVIQKVRFANSETTRNMM